jgi:hypothetical protein
MKSKRWFHAVRSGQKSNQLLFFLFPIISIIGTPKAENFLIVQNKPISINSNLSTTRSSSLNLKSLAVTLPSAVRGSIKPSFSS